MLSPVEAKLGRKGKKLVKNRYDPDIHGREEQSQGISEIKAPWFRLFHENNTKRKKPS